ncbi:uncharacterized protein LOC143916882 [Arctopsyche grandis]|uniref:uncharacterized protein LOC143916882 n=1 Tax=Arctopsyche grandis TaxID=121162 RepID=UPI00406D96CF
MNFLRRFSTTAFRRSDLKTPFHRKDCVKVSEEVLQSLAEAKPVVALESTIITHGMPFPRNLETAMQVERVVRDHGAVPATIAILAGKIHVGVSEEDLRALAEKASKPGGPIKVSRRDFPQVLAAKLDGGTTVAGTMIIADRAGIRVFVTGGIGGVHRGGQETMDVSADLVELGRTPICVVSSGVKSILDIGRTLEFLETQGVCVATYGPTSEFPAFYTRSSGFQSPCRTSSPQEAARMLKATIDLELNSGLLIAVPIPEEHAMNELEMEKAIWGALCDADRRGIKGKEVTPFILSAVARVTGGKSLEANVALIKNNAKVGAQIAVSYSELKSNLDAESPQGRGTFMNMRNTQGEPSTGSAKSEPLGAPPVVIGGSNMDSTIKILEPEVKLDGSTHRCNVVKSWGGVARNIADCLHGLGGRPVLLTALGEDSLQVGLYDFECRSPKPEVGSNTANYTAVLDNRGECLIGFGDMAIHDTITPQWILQNRDVIEKAPLIVLDGNVPIQTMSCVLELACELNIPVFFEPTDQRKAIKPFKTEHWKAVKFATPNMNELKAIAFSLGYNKNHLSKDNMQLALELSSYVANHIDNLLITLGKIYGVCSNDDLNRRLYPIPREVNVKNVSGAGDCLAGGFIYSMLKGLKEDVCMSIAFTSAETSLMSEQAVPKVFFNEENNCNDDILGLLPTVIFMTSIGAILYKDGYQNSFEDSQQQFLQMLLLLGLFIFTVRTWLFSIKVLKWTIKQMLKMATCNGTEQNSIKGLLEVFQEQEDFVHLTLCFAFALIPANYVCDTKLYQFYFKHVQHVVPTSMADVNTLTSISATSFIVQICMVLKVNGICNPMQI